MTLSPCIIDGCVKFSGAPGTAKGLCSTHYSRLRRHGDPEAVFRRARSTCAIEGCNEFVKTRGLCSKHETRLRRHGSTDHPQEWANAPSGMKWCPACKTYKSHADFHRHSGATAGLAAYCRPCVSIQDSKRRTGNPTYQRPKHAARCVICGSAFQADKRTRMACSLVCRRIAKRQQGRAYVWDPAARAEAQRRWRQKYPEKVREKSRAYRARKRRALVERFSEREIYERDRWRCQICSEFIDSQLEHPNPFSPSIDHRIPLARGGDHSRANCQAAHLICNVRKGVRMT